MKQIENLLKQTMGLDAASIGSSLISQTVRLRMQSHGLTKLQDYSRFLQETPAELSALVEAVVVKETWFFRDKEPFNALVRLVLNEWLPAHPVGPLRLLSVPCSTGEEPYSMAMALLDAGLPAERFQIDAVDISSHALESARRAVYRKNSFRGQARDYREHHFQSFEDGYVLNQTVRDQVRFHKGNVLEANPDGPLGHGGIYDFIFCRNLLIYFDRPTQGKVLQKLERLLKKSGVLFVGPVELPLVAREGFVSARIPMAAACRKKVDSSESRPVESAALLHGVKVESKNPQPSALNSQLTSPRHPKPSSKSVAARSTPTTATPRPPSPTASITKSSPRGVVGAARPVELPPLLHRPSQGARITPQGEPTTGRKQQEELENAAQLADAGRLAEAAQLCENHIRDHGASAQVYYLLGLVRDAQGNDAQAADFYRKALYLEPNHYETLVQMATLTGKKGDSNGARLLHKRLARVVADGGGPALRPPITTRAKQRVLAKT